MSEQSWAEFVRRCNDCRACGLGEQRTQAVVWRGAVSAPLLLIGEGPGAHEDLEGKPFVGRSGKLLDQALEAHGIAEDDYHIMNMVKCRPPKNRKPTAEEVQACRPLLRDQFLFVKPQVIVLLGSTAYQYFTGDKTPITKVRGIWQESNHYHILPVFHPAYVLRDPRQKELFFNDIAEVRLKLEALDLIQPLL